MTIVECLHGLFIAVAEGTPLEWFCTHNIVVGCGVTQSCGVAELMRHNHRHVQVSDGTGIPFVVVIGPCVVPRSRYRSENRRWLFEIEPHPAEVRVDGTSSPAWSHAGEQIGMCSALPRSAEVLEIAGDSLESSYHHINGGVHGRLFIKVNWLWTHALPQIHAVSCPRLELVDCRLQSVVVQDQRVGEGIGHFFVCNVPRVLDLYSVAVIVNDGRFSSFSQFHSESGPTVAKVAADESDGIIRARPA